MSPGSRRCCFSDALGERVAGCSKALKSTRQYRRAVYCTSGEAHGVCVAWLNRVRSASRFTFRVPRTPSALPRPAATKLQCGGLLGMQDLLEGDTDGADGRIQDVSELLRRAIRRFGSVAAVPLEAVVRRVQQFETNDG